MKYTSKWLFLLRWSSNIIHTASKTALVVTMLCWLNVGIGQSTFQIHINKSKSDIDVLNELQQKYKVFIAFDPSLPKVIIDQERIVNAKDAQELLQKVSLVYGLTITPHESNAYLVQRNTGGKKKLEKHFHFQLVEAVTEQPIDWALIQILETKTTILSDDFGDAFTALPIYLDTIHVTIHSISHQTATFKIALEDNYIKVKLDYKPVPIEEAKINGFKELLKSYKAGSIIGEGAWIDLVSLASGFGIDVTRSLQLLAGVNASNDRSAALNIRGSGEDATLVLVDNLPIYKADHFYGIFSTFNPSYIQSFELHRNNIPVDYGGRTSGMLHLRSNDQIQSTKVSADLNLLTASIFGDIVINKDFKCLLSARKSFSNFTFKNINFITANEEKSLINTIGQEVEIFERARPNFDFYDIHARLIYSKNKHRFDFNYFNSGDVLQNEISLMGSTDDLQPFSSSYHNGMTWSNMAAGMNYLYLFQKIHLKSSVYYTKHSHFIDSDGDLLLGTTETRKIADIYNENFIEDISAKVEAQLQRKHPITLGLEGIHHNNILYLENDKLPFFEVNRTGVEWNMYGKMHWKINDKIDILPGMRTMYLPDVSDVYFLPQIEGFYQIRSNLSGKYSAGRHAQYVRWVEHENQLGQAHKFIALSNAASIPTAIGINTMIGLKYQWKAIVADIEAYYRFLDGVVMHATKIPRVNSPNLDGFVAEFSIFDGKSFVKGVDMSLKVNQGRYLGIVNYTLSSSTQRFDEIFDNIAFPTSFDSRHQIKCINIYRFNGLEVSLNYIVANGRPYLDLSVLDMDDIRTAINPNLYINRLPNYHRVDGGIAYSIKQKSSKIQLSLSVHNLFNRTNVNYRQFVFKSNNFPTAEQNLIFGADIIQLNRTVNLGLKWLWHQK